MIRRPLLIALAVAFIFGGVACRKEAPVTVPVPPPPVPQAEIEPEVDPEPEAEDEVPSDAEAFPAEEASPELPEPDPEPEPAEPSDLELADLEFEQGNLEAAVHLYETALGAPETSRQDRAHAMLRSAVAQLLPSSPYHNPEQGRERIEALVEEFPENPLALEANLILLLLEELNRLESENRNQAARIKELNDRLDALKRIDLRRGDQRPPR